MSVFSSLEGIVLYEEAGQCIGIHIAVFTVTQKNFHDRLQRLSTFLCYFTAAAALTADLPVFTGDLGTTERSNKSRIICQTISRKFLPEQKTITYQLLKLGLKI
jgi:hypothetical protein